MMYFLKIIWGCIPVVDCEIARLVDIDIIDKTTASPKVEEALIGIISKSFKNDKVFEVVGIKFGLVKSAIFCHFFGSNIYIDK